MTVQTGHELFHETDERFTYWYADAYGIHAGFTIGAYQNRSIEEMKQIRDDLTAIIEYCEQFENDFADL